MTKTPTLSSNLSTWETILINIQNIPEVTEEMHSFGYTKERLCFGLGLVEEVKNLDSNQAAEYGDKSQAFEDFEKAFDMAYKKYMRNLKIARVAFSDNIEAKVALMLNGDRKNGYSSWKNQAETFYGNLLNNKKYLEIAVNYSLQPDSLIADYQAVKELELLNSNYQKEKGQAIASTQTRNEKALELDKFMRELTKLLKIVFEDRTGYLTMLGIK